jgi:rRNA pseudouridine-1189 N-methylase Emg1 (Nep1/Mra1 family)
MTTFQKNHMDIIKKLKLALSNSDLKEDEIAFYISVLKKPGATIFDIAKSAKIPKDRAYKIFSALEEKRLLSSAQTPNSSERKQKKIIANPIENFIETIYAKGRKFYRTADSLKQVKPFLKLLNTPYEDVAIQSFGSEEMAENWVDLSYLNFDTCLAYGSFEMMVENMGVEADQQFMGRRVKRGKKAFPILTEIGKYSREMIINRDIRELRDTKVLETERLKNIFVTLFPDIDTISIWLKNREGKITGTQIKNPLIARLHEDIFWELADTARHPFPTTPG